MDMKKTLLPLFVSLVIFTSCWQRESPQSFVRPVKIAEAVSMSYYEKDFVGQLTAKQYTNLAFQVGGLINSISVSEGSAVKVGQILARLDTQDFQLQLEADKAQYLTTKSILERNERLLERQAISTQDAEIARANYQKAKSAYEYTQNQIQYTYLRAPFSGSIEAKYAEVYQKVSAGETIFKLINPTVLEVSFTLPETDINMTLVSAEYQVQFENIKGKSYRAEIKEIVDASVDGMGIPITLKITDPDFDPIKQNIKAGFACIVKVRIADKNRALDGMVRVPVTAIFTQNTQEGKKSVWVYDRSNGSVSMREITTRGLMSDSDAIVSEGLSAGEQVVTAGVYQLVDNQKVTILE